MSTSSITDPTRAATMSSFAMRAALTRASCSFAAPSTRPARLDFPHGRGSKLRTRALTPEVEKMFFILGVSPGASQEATKRAYKRLAKQYHPDVCDAPDADTRFAEISSAYQTLMAEKGTLANVGSEVWRAKWSQQLRTMGQVERGATTMNVRRRRVVRRNAQPSGSEQSESSGNDARHVEDLGNPLDSDEKDDETNPYSADSEWRREREMRTAVRAQLGGLRDRTRRRRVVTPPQKGKFKEPFLEQSRTAHDDEWNHSVQ